MNFLRTLSNVASIKLIEPTPVYSEIRSVYDEATKSTGIRLDDHYRKRLNERCGAHFRVKEFLFPRNHFISEKEKVAKPGVTQDNTKFSAETCLQKFFLFTENVNDFEFFYSTSEERGYGWVVAGIFGLGPKNRLFISGPATSLDILDEQNLFKRLFLNENQPYFTKITVQTSIFDAFHYDGLLWRGINYLKLESGVNNVLELGEIHAVGRGENAHVLYSECDEVEGKLIINGVGTDKYNLACFQVVDLSGCVTVPVETQALSEMCHGTSILGVKPCATKLSRMEKYRAIAVEDLEVLATFHELAYHANDIWVTDTTYSMLPQFLSILSKSMESPMVIQSVLRIAHVLFGRLEELQTESSGASHSTSPPESSKQTRHFKEMDFQIVLEIPPSNVKNVALIWGALTKTVVFVKQISDRRVLLKLNLLQCAILKHDLKFTAGALLVGLCQISLTGILFFYAWSNLHLFWEFPPAAPFSFVSFVLVSLTVANDVLGTWNFISTFQPEKSFHKRDWVLLCVDFFVNIICACCLALLTFILIGTSDDFLDIVLNSVALVFVVQLDDTINPLDNIHVDDLVREFLITQLLVNLEETSKTIRLQQKHPKLFDLTKRPMKQPKAKV